MASTHAGGVTVEWRQFGGLYGDSGEVEVVSGTLKRFRSIAVRTTEASRIPVGLPDFKSGGPF
jgi:hypothetical protein